MAAVEQQLLGFQVALEAGSASAATLQAANASLAAEHAAAVAAAAAAAANTKRLAAEVSGFAAELDETREQLTVVKVGGQHSARCLPPSHASIACR